MLPILPSVSAISFAGAIVPGPTLAVTLAISYKIVLIHMISDT